MKYFSSLNGIIKSIILLLLKIGVCFKNKKQIEKRVIITDYYKIITKKKFAE